ncbi:MAG: hypothetical protein A2Z91_02400 [Deltaproteobacteria bacterium GWA2_38_16]|nr:MAG: hypothetical protein A2Z91_02400 [Deltaproteobacteria bacterium GWA2_38_16]OGQ02045.1 MAG: hypothetical protein A3D19_08695 [Deltaproteobacteria bacterium RIFCSPHIGHO2_02_FULL_38_15]HBQ21581.1 hypothetical protein [Deltaproteobacteria bacterium]
MGVFLFACGEKNSLPQEERLPAKSDENHNMMLETPTEEEEENISLASYKDSFYNTLYHVALKSDLSSDIEVTWEVSGGRYYILDEEVPELQNKRPTQRTILFLQKNKYEVLAAVILNGEKQILKKTDIDLTRLEEPSYDIRADFGVDKLAFQVGEKVELMGEVEKNQHTFNENEILKYQWEIKKIKPVYCPSGFDSVDICNKSYEEVAISGEDYHLEKETSIHPSIVFNKEGQYVIYFWVLDEAGNFLAKFSKKFKPEPVLLTHR